MDMCHVCKVISSLLEIHIRKQKFARNNYREKKINPLRKHIKNTEFRELNADNIEDLYNYY